MKPPNLPLTSFRQMEYCGDCIGLVRGVCPSLTGRDNYQHEMRWRIRKVSARLIFQNRQGDREQRQSSFDSG